MTPSTITPTTLIHSIAVFTYGTLWRMILLFVCLPLWGFGLCFVTIGYLMVDLANATRTGLEKGGVSIDSI
jgi:hypothetical protein